MKSSPQDRFQWRRRLMVAIGIWKRLPTPLFFPPLFFPGMVVRRLHLITGASHFLHHHIKYLGLSECHSYPSPLISSIAFCAFFALAPYFAEETLAASFDCEKATTEVEKLICLEDRLSNLDESLSRVYLWTIEFSSETEQQVLRKDQRHWIINVRDKCGASVACLNEAYVKRFNLLEAQYPRKLANNNEVLERLYRRGVMTPNQARESLKICSESAPAKLQCISILLSAAELKLELLTATKNASLATCQPGLKELHSLWKDRQSRRCEKELEESNLGGSSASIVLDGCNVDTTVEQINRLRSISKCSDISSVMHQLNY